MLIFTLFLAPCAGSSSLLWPTAILGVISLVATLLFLTGACLRRYDFMEIVGAAPLFLFLLFPLLQLIPLPPLVVEAISPATHQLYEPLLQLNATERWIPLSVMPKATLLKFFQLAGYVCTYILTVQLLSHPLVLKKGVTYLVFFGAGLALWSILQRIVVEGDTSGRFVAFFVLACPVALSLFFYYRPVSCRDEGWKKKIATLFADPGLYRHYYFGCSAVLMLVTAVILINSYTGGSGQVGVWLSSFEIVKQFPLLGTGLGSFETMCNYSSFPIGGFVANQLQAFGPMLPVEMGAVGTMLGVWFLLAVMWHVWGKIQARTDRFVVLLGGGVLSGIALFILYFFWFFSQHGGLAGCQFFFFLGLLVATVNCRFAYLHPGTMLKVAIPASRCVSAAVAVVLLFISVLFHGGIWYAGSLQNAATFFSNSSDRSAVQHKVEMETLLKALRFDPLESKYSTSLGQLELDAGNDDEGMRHLLSGGFKNVMKGEVFQKIGFIRQGSVDEKTRLIEMGYRRAPYMEEPAKIYAQWLFDNGKRAEALAVIGERLRSQYRVVVGWMPLLKNNRVNHKELRQLLPRSVDAWLYLAGYSETNSSWVDSDFYYGGALILISEADSIKPEWFLAIINYYRKNQRLDMAVLCIRRAITLLPEVGVFHRLLGDYYFNKGVMYRAREEYELALLLDPKDTQARRQLQAL